MDDGDEFEANAYTRIEFHVETPNGYIEIKKADCDVELSFCALKIKFEALLELGPWKYQEWWIDGKRVGDYENMISHGIVGASEEPVVIYVKRKVIIPEPN